MKQTNPATLEAEKAIRSVLTEYKLEYAELSPVIRELLASVYIRGGIDAVHKLQQK